MRNFIILFQLIFLISCQEPFHGSRIVANLSFGSEIEAINLAAPSMSLSGVSDRYTFLDATDSNYVHHYELYAGIRGQGTIRLKNFFIKPVIETHNPCMQFIDDILNTNGEKQFLNMCQSPYPVLEKQVYGLVSVPPSDIGDKNPGPDYYEWGKPLRAADNTVEEPSCTADASGNYLKIKYDEAATKEFCSHLHKDYYLGSPFQISAPLNGTLYGLIDGSDPRSGLVLGGILFSVSYKLDEITSIFVVAEPDETRVSAENIDKNLPPDPGGKIILLGETDGSFGYLDKNMFEGDWHGLMVDPEGSSLRMEFTLFYDLDKDTIYF